MRYSAKDHTFVICAYKENLYLEQTILSLKNQTKKSIIILSTSTPNEHIRGLCKKYQINMYINPNPHLAGDDWNYGYMQAKTPLITIAHQDDIYEPHFLENILTYINRRKDAIITFTDYYELRNNRKIKNNYILWIKRILNMPLSIPIFYRSKFIRKMTLSVGCAICCPSVTYIRRNVGDNPFDIVYKNSCDYKTWINLAKQEGAFIYIPKKLILHRIYSESATTHNLNENIRKREDMEIMCEFWPKSIAKIINNLYSLSEKSNKL